MNEKIKIAVCDDEKLQLELICELLAEVINKFFTVYELISYTSVEKLLQDNISMDFELVIMDIRMNEMDGFEAAKILRKHNSNQGIIFITSEFELVFDSFEYGPIDFIRKRSRNEVKKVLYESLERFSRQLCEDVTCLKAVGGSLLKVNWNDILWFESIRNYLECHLKKGEVIKIRKTLKQQEAEMPKGRFVQVNKGTLVNIRYIDSIEIKHRWVCGKEINRIELTKKFEREVLEKFMDNKTKHF